MIGSRLDSAIRGHVIPRCCQRDMATVGSNAFSPRRNAYNFVQFGHKQAGK